MESSQQKWREEVYFPWAVAQDIYHGSVLNSLHFITQTEIEDVNLVGQKQKRSRALSVGIVFVTASILFHNPVAGHRSVHTPIQRELTVFKLCSSWVSSLYLCDIQVAVFK